MQYATVERFCPKCGSPLPADASACLTCGYAVGNNVSSRDSSINWSGVAARMLWIASVLAIAFVVLAFGIFVLVETRLTDTQAYKDAIAIAKSSPEVQSTLGNDIKTEWPALGYDLSFHGSQFAQWSVKLSGSRGEGHLYGVANGVLGWWEYSRLAFVAENRRNRVELNNAPHLLRVPSVPAKKLYLIPIGLSESESLDWAPRYYKAKLGIDAVVLPPASLDPKLEDPERHQLNADRCVDFLSQLHPDLARDPFAILIGVTSRDMFIPDFALEYAENLRTEGRFAIVSSARLHPPSLMEKWNPEWLNSRLEKILTKNIAILYFELPMSDDYTSLLSAGVLSGLEIDEMGGQVVGANGAWKPFLNSGDPGFTIYDLPGKPPLWRTDYIYQAVKDTRAQLFSTDLALGLFVQRKMEFIFDDEYPLRFTRVYTNNDDRSRAFGIGATDTLDVALTGQMGSYVDLSTEDGARIHFVHQVPRPGQGNFDVYVEPGGWSGPYTRTQARFDGKVWRVKRNDGWTFVFPYHPEWLPQYVTVLTAFTDPAGHEYKMERDNWGDLLSITTPSGKWLHFENDGQHRIRRIESSLGRTVRYEYDAGGRLIRATDSDGHVDAYTYDEKAQMLTVRHEDGAPVLINAYSNDSYIKSQTVADGSKFGFSYFRQSRNVIYESQITDPHGMLTSFLFRGGCYTQTLPTPGPQ